MIDKPTFAGVDAVLASAAGSEFTACVARIEHRGRLVYEKAYGITRDDELARGVYGDTRFDLASLTKLFVATLALALVADGRLTLDESLVAIVPEWRERPHAAITLRMLLAHTSGMNSGADYRSILDENVERFALRSNLIADPGERVVYSDLGFIALGAILSRVTGTSLATALARRFGPLVGYRLSEAERAWAPATERDDWRGRVQGFVHDEKAYLMGGTAGHAGVFGSAAAVAHLVEVYLGPACGRAATLLRKALASEAIAEQAFDPVLRRGLGWALKTNDDNSCGRLFDSTSFGHTGFVGTCVWADPVRDFQGVLLTNAVYFGRNPPASSGHSLRVNFYQAMVEDLERTCARSA